MGYKNPKLYTVALGPYLINIQIIKKISINWLDVLAVHNVYRMNINVINVSI